MREKIARVIRVTPRKTVTVLVCWIDGAERHCLINNDVSRPKSGDLVRLFGDEVENAFAVRAFELIAEPDQHESWRERWSSDVRRTALYVRAEIIDAMMEVAFREGFKFVTNCDVVPPQIAAGTFPFKVCSGGRSAELTVSSLIRQQQLQAIQPALLVQLSRLYWRHGSNRMSLNELHVFEISMANFTRVDVMLTVEGLLRAAAATGRVRSAAPWFAGAVQAVPRLTYDDIVRICSDERREMPAGAHVIPSWVDDIVTRRIGVELYWLIDTPSAGNPFYVRRHEDRPDRAVSMELRARGVNEFGSGSEWLRDERVATENLGSVAMTAAGRRYLQTLPQLPPCAAFTLGIDRMITAVLGLNNIRVATPVAIDRASFPLAADATPMIGTNEIRNEVITLSVLSARSAAVRTTVEKLRCRAFVPVSTTVLANGDDCDTRHAEVDFFGRRIYAGAGASYHPALLAAGMDRIYEVTSLVDDGGYPRPVLIVSMLGLNAETALSFWHELIRDITGTVATFDVRDLHFDIRLQDSNIGMVTTGGRDVSGSESGGISSLPISSMQLLIDNLAKTITH